MSNASNAANVGCLIVYRTGKTECLLETCSSGPSDTVEINAIWLALLIRTARNALGPLYRPWTVGQFNWMFHDAVINYSVRIVQYPNWPLFHGSLFQN